MSACAFVGFVSSIACWPQYLVLLCMYTRRAWKKRSGVPGGLLWTRQDKERRGELTCIDRLATTSVPASTFRLKLILASPLSLSPSLGCSSATAWPSPGLPANGLTRNSRDYLFLFMQLPHFRRDRLGTRLCFEQQTLTKGGEDQTVSACPYHGRPVYVLSFSFLFLSMSEVRSATG